MSERYTRKDAEAAFARLASALGKTWAGPTGQLWTGKPYEPTAAGWLWNREDVPGTDDGSGNPRQTNRATVGAWALDYAGVYGGFVVHEMSNEGGGVACPLGHMRRNAREFCEAVRFTLDAFAVAREVRA